MKNARTCVTALMLSVLAGWGGCSGAASSRVEPTATQKARDETAQVDDRIEAVEQIWAARGADRLAAREQLKRIIWSARSPAPVRIAAIGKLIDDAEDVGNADTRAMCRLLIPTEPNSAVRDYVCQQASQRQWTEMIPAIVRAWSRRSDVADAQRAERAAVQALAPGKPVEETVFEVFSAPIPAEVTGNARDWASKAKSAAYEVLGRIDPDGSVRTRLLASTPSAGAGSDAMTAAMQACAAELLCVPITAEQMNWVVKLRDSGNQLDAQRRQQWWAQTAAAVRSLDRSRCGPVALRNLEAIRWASANAPSMLAMTRDQLLDQLKTQLSDRRFYTRFAGTDAGGETFAENLSDNRDKLTWADLLTVLVIDQAVRSGAVVKALSQQIARDMKDTSTEYGGVLESGDLGGAGGGPAFSATLYPPRPTARQGDKKFVASDDLLAHGGWSLAHYHFHAQEYRNGSYAGPGSGDMDYARIQGRACIVITPVNEREANVDYYQGNGARLDLGTIEIGR